MEEMKQNQPEIKDGKLIIDGTVINLVGLTILADEAGTIADFGEELQELFISISMIGSLIAAAGPSGEIDAESLSLNFPPYRSLYSLKVVTEALKKM